MLQKLTFGIYPFINIGTRDFERGHFFQSGGAGVEREGAGRNTTFLEDFVQHAIDPLCKTNSYDCS